MVASTLTDGNAAGSGSPNERDFPGRLTVQYIANTVPGGVPSLLLSTNEN